MARGEFAKALKDVVTPITGSWDRRQVPGQVWRRRGEEVLLEVRRGRQDSADPGQAHGNAHRAKGVAMTGKHRHDSVTIDEGAVIEVLVPRR